MLHCKHHALALETWLPIQSSTVLLKKLDWEAGAQILCGCIFAHSLFSPTPSSTSSSSCIVSHFCHTLLTVECGCIFAQHSPSLLPLPPVLLLVSHFSDGNLDLSPCKLGSTQFILFILGFSWRKLYRGYSVVNFRIEKSNFCVWKADVFLFTTYITRDKCL